MTSRGSTSFRSEINVTPLVDVVLVLLIIFMVIVPLALRGHDVDIPGSAVREDLPAVRTEQFVLTIDPEGCAATEHSRDGALPEPCRVRINGEELAVAGIGLRVAEIFGGRDPVNRVLFLAADDDLNYEAVMQIVDMARSAVTDLRIGIVSLREAADS